MSAIYHTEPPTQGKVLLKTSYGDIDIELWSKEAPLACRNFIQLALEGYFDDTNIHRVIKDFMVQMGDPTGTGTGGESIWGRPFKDEIHGRILFNHRGQVAMANENKPHTNQSQFFITLAPCEWLNRKHTIFGKVTGDTVFNLLRMGEAEVDGNERPLEPIRLIGVEVLWNPIDDIVPRDIKKKAEAPTKVLSAQEVARQNRKATKDKKLLSFGDDEEEAEGEADAVIIKKQSFAMPSRGGKEKTSREKDRDEGDRDGDGDADGGGGYKRDTNARTGQSVAKVDSGSDKKVLETTREKKDIKNNVRRGRVDDDDEDNDTDDDGGDISYDYVGSSSQQSKHQTTLLKQKEEELQKLKEGLIKSRRAVKILTGADAAQHREEAAKKDLVTPLEQRRLKYVKRKAELGDRQEETFAKLQQFTKSLRASKSALTKKTESTGDRAEDASAGSGGGGGGGSGASGSGGGPAETETYHGQVLERDSDDEERIGGLNDDWHVGKLKFRKHIDDSYRIGGDGRAVDDYAVIDTRKK